MIDYFKPAPSAEENILRRIKGNQRRSFVGAAIKDKGLESIPEAWTTHDLSSNLKNLLQQQHPAARGGEDLPDLEDGEVEIARLSLTNSVHGEVTSLRAKQEGQSAKIVLRMVDEYESEIALPRSTTDAPLTSEQVVCLFRDADPSATKTQCEFEFHSFFYDDLNEVAGRLGLNNPAVS
jgi:hypothetical protein